MTISLFWFHSSESTSLLLRITEELRPLMELNTATLEIFTNLEQQWLSHCQSAKKTRILSIDGGGTEAVVAGASLVRLEDQIHLQTGDPSARVADFFDLVAGTGIGAILASLIVAEDDAGRPLYTARDAVNAVSERKSEMFKVKFSGVFRRRQKFSGKCMDRVLMDLFKTGNGKFLTLKDTCKPLLIPCFDLNSSAPFVFSRADASESPSFNFELWKVCRATLSTPMLFKPFGLSSIDGETSCVAVTGGLVMNNPTAAAVTHVLHNKRDFPSVNGIEDLLILSLGNGPSIGSSTGKIPHNGDCFTSTVIEIVLDGISETIDQMMGNTFSWNRSDYVRIQAFGGLGKEMVEEEVLNERGLESLAFGRKLLTTESNRDRIDSLVQRLITLGRSSLSPRPSKYPGVILSPRRPPMTLLQ